MNKKTYWWWEEYKASLYQVREIAKDKGNIDIYIDHNKECFYSVDDIHIGIPEGAKVKFHLECVDGDEYIVITEQYNAVKKVWNAPEIY